MQIFENIENAFKSRNTKELKKARLLFAFMSYPWLVRVAGIIASLVIRMKLPHGWLIRPTVFSHFCGGETLEESGGVINHLAEFRVRSVTDYAAENKNSDDEIEAVMKEVLRTIDFAAGNPFVPFAVFKPTALAPVDLLTLASSYSPSAIKNNSEIEKFLARIKTLCQAAYDNDVPVMIDAEESYYQAIIDQAATEMMKLFNKEKAMVFNTLQMYRHDRLDFLNESIRMAEENNYYLGLKLVRGAYMDQERKRARIMGYPSPIHPDKESTDKAFNTALTNCIRNIDRTSIFVGTHNEESLLLLTGLMKKFNIDNTDPRIFVSQLYGMSDHISFNMASLSYNVAKYLPYGPVEYLLPYLIRRAEENRSVTGQAGRELHLINLEIKRRNLLKIKNHDNR